MIETLLRVDDAWLRSIASIPDSSWQLPLQLSAEGIVFFVMILLVSLWITGVIKHTDIPKYTALNIFFTITLTFTVYTILNLLNDPFRPNPQDIVEGISAIIPHPTDNSFPSGHSIFTAATIVALFRYFKNKPILILAFCIGAITVSARVLSGIHYPGDVLAGLLCGWIGATIASACINRTPWFQKKLYPFMLQLASFFRL